MFDKSTGPRVFGLPPGCDFTEVFLRGLRDRLVASPPEAIGRVEIFVNSRRTERRLRELFLNGPAGFLPRIRVITDLASDPMTGADLPPPVSPLRRRLELAQAVGALLKAEPDLAPRSAVFDLADSLGDLMDEMHGEGVSPSVLEKIDVENHAEHWQKSLKFLTLLSDFFKDSSEPDAEARQRLVVEHLARRWENDPPQHPVIVAGSTGSRGATSLFMKAVANLPLGAVVLPGYDFALGDDIRLKLLEPEAGGDHPQTGLAKLVRSIGTHPVQVRPWADVEPACPPRNALVSLALRPAPVTDQWLIEGPKLENLSQATERMALVTAPNPRHEALSIALRLRRAVEDGIRATLISPDRQLTRQVTAALSRWNIIPDDSAGHPLPLTPPGVYLRLVSELFAQQLNTEMLLILLKHPLTHSAGGDRNKHLLRTRDLELQMIRGGAPFPDFDAYADWARERDNDPGATPWVEWMRRILENCQSEDHRHLAQHLALHRDLAEALANGPVPEGESELWQKEPGIEAQAIFTELEANADAAGEMSVVEYIALFRSVLNRAEVRDPQTPHPNITIWGTLEARVQGADLVILGGLNDGTWPKLPEPDPWLSRQMREQAGLLLPERRIGLSAHDFQQAIAAKEVMLTRSARDADAPTVASRWLIRLTNLLSGLGQDGKDAFEAMERRGQYWLDLASELERPSMALPPQKRPAPRPPVESRPDQLSVTQIKTLIRDPYAIYAQKILHLKKLDPIRTQPDAMIRGNAIHSLFEEFIKGTLGGLSDNAAGELIRQAAEVFEREVPWPASRRLWLARIIRIADRFARAEAGRRERGIPEAFEKKAALRMEEPRFTLTAKADRIDRAGDGGLIVYDYKTGAIPTSKQVEHFDKQLPLQGKMIEEGAFADIDPGPLSGLEYIGLGNDLKILSLKLDDDLVNETWEGLRKLIRAYQQHETGYIARARMETRTSPSDYDHLSRRGEWDDTDDAAPEDVG